MYKYGISIDQVSSHIEYKFLGNYNDDSLSIILHHVYEVRLFQSKCCCCSIALFSSLIWQKFLFISLFSQLFVWTCMYNAVQPSMHGVNKWDINELDRCCKFELVFP